jgi:prepilin-type N-terminal cleavage/methylation domain-containing protein/prepilin-type processing-associated H-X9-DG protein
MKRITYLASDYRAAPEIIVVRRAFTLVELLVVITIIAVLASMLLPALARAKAQASGIHCLSQMRQIGLATLLYADDHESRLPRSTHSAMAYGQLPWGYALLPYVAGQQYTGQNAAWTNTFNGIYRCPKDKRRNADWSYGKSVYPELTEDETGGRTWARIEQIPRPSVTVLFAEKASGSMADHFMANFWREGGQPEVDQHRHGKRSNYILCDGRASSLRFEETFDLKRNLDNWNPETAQ